MRSSIFAIVLIVALVILAWSTLVMGSMMDDSQFQQLLDNGKFIIGVWQTLILGLMVSLALFLWRRIAKNEDDFRASLEKLGDESRAKDSDIERALRHRVNDLHQAIHGASGMLIEQARIHEVRVNNVLQKLDEVNKDCIKLRERVREIELKQT